MTDPTDPTPAAMLRDGCPPEIVCDWLAERDATLADVLRLFAGAARDDGWKAGRLATAYAVLSEWCLRARWPGLDEMARMPWPRSGEFLAMKIEARVLAGNVEEGDRLAEEGIGRLFRDHARRRLALFPDVVVGEKTWPLPGAVLAAGTDSVAPGAGRFGPPSMVAGLPYIVINGERVDAPFVVDHTDPSCPLVRKTMYAPDLIPPGRTVSSALSGRGGTITFDGGPTLAVEDWRLELAPVPDATSGGLDGADPPAAAPEPVRRCQACGRPDSDRLCRGCRREQRRQQRRMTGERRRLPGPHHRRPRE